MSWFRRTSAPDPEATAARMRELTPHVPEQRRRWNAWRDDVFGDGYMVWHEGADTGASTARWREDPDATAAALVLGLAEDDHVAAQAVEAFARAGGDPGPEVTAAVVAATGSERPAAVRIAAAVAAYVLTGDPAFAEVVVGVLGRRSRVRGDSDDARMTAARLLTAFPTTPRIADALADAVAHDPEYLVRSHAVDSLLALAGQAPEPPFGLPHALVETISERGSAAGRAALARDLRARVDAPQD